MLLTFLESFLGWRIFRLYVGELWVCSAVVSSCGHLCSRLNQWSHCTALKDYTCGVTVMSGQNTTLEPFHTNSLCKIKKSVLVRPNRLKTSFPKKDRKYHCLKKIENWTKLKTEKNIRKLVLRVGTSLSVVAPYYLLFCDFGAAV